MAFNYDYTGVSVTGKQLCPVDGGTALPVSVVSIAPAITTDAPVAFGYDSATGRPVRVEKVADSDGTITTTYTYQDDGTLMVDPTLFTTSAPDSGVEAANAVILPDFVFLATGEGPVWVETTYDDAGTSTPQFFYIDNTGAIQMTAGNNVGVNPAATATQSVGTYHNDYFAPVGGGAVTVTAADIIADAVAAGALVFSGGVGAPVTAAEFIASIDIDLKPVNGHGNIAGVQETSTTSQATVNDGSITDVDPGGSRTVGGLINAGFREPTNFTEIVIAEGSIVTIGATLASVPA